MMPMIQIKLPIKTAGDLCNVLNAFAELRALVRRGGRESFVKKLNARMAEKGGSFALWCALVRVTDFAEPLYRAELEVCTDQEDADAVPPLSEE